MIWFYISAISMCNKPFWTWYWHYSWLKMSNQFRSSRTILPWIKVIVVHVSSINTICRRLGPDLLHCSQRHLSLPFLCPCLSLPCRFVARGFCLANCLSALRALCCPCSGGDWMLDAFYSRHTKTAPAGRLASARSPALIHIERGERGQRNTNDKTHFLMSHPYALFT